MRASPRLAAAALRAPPVSASPSTGSRTTRRLAGSARVRAPAERTRTSLRTAPCSRVRTGADTAARTALAVLRTSPCSIRCTSRRSSAAAASPCRSRRRRFPESRCWPIGRPGPPGRPWFSHPTHRWCMARVAAQAASFAHNTLIVCSSARPCRAGNSTTNLVARPSAHVRAHSATPCRPCPRSRAGRLPLQLPKWWRAHLRTAMTGTNLVAFASP